MKLKKEQLQKLPFRLIIYEILVHVIYDSTNPNHKEFDCFGYFAKDKFRKIFPVFRSVVICQYGILIPRFLQHITVSNFKRMNLEFFLSHKEIVSLELEICDEKFTEKIFRNRIFDSLKYLYLDGISIDDNLDFSNMKKIKKLTLAELPFITGENLFDLQNLVELKICDCECFNDSLFQYGNIHRLKKLKISGSNQICGTKWKYLEKIKKIEIDLRWEAHINEFSFYNSYSDQDVEVIIIPKWHEYVVHGVYVIRNIMFFFPKILFRCPSQFY